MVKALLFIIKISLFTIAAVWIVQRPGEVVIDWADYTFTVHLGSFLLLLVLLFLVGLALFRLIVGILSLPDRAKAFRYRKLQQKGHRALLRGFSAAAAGDAKAAAKHAEHARNMLDGDDGLILLLEAQAARLSGQSVRAEAVLQQLMEHRDLAFLGLRGLINLNAERGEIDKALYLTMQAQKMHPKQPWILRTLYQLQLHHRDWDAAWDTLGLAEKSGALAREQADSDRVALLTLEADRDIQNGFRGEALRKLKKANRIDPGFVPVAARLAQVYKLRRARRHGVKAIENAWKIAPHPELATIWDELSPKPRASDPTVRLRWFEKLLSLNPQSVEGQLAVARAAIDDRLWGEARAYLSRAEVIRPTARGYRLRAEIEEKSGHDMEQTRFWLEKAATAPADKVWTCAVTGRVYDKWHAVAEPHGSFNTIRWGFPDEVRPNETPVLFRGDETLFLPDA